jgi:hypothetical protein
MVESLCTEKLRSSFTLRLPLFVSSTGHSDASGSDGRKSDLLLVAGVVWTLLLEMLKDDML